jgi:hypothetical protein
MGSGRIKSRRRFREPLSFSYKELRVVKTSLSGVPPGTLFAFSGFCEDRLSDPQYGADYQA